MSFITKKVQTKTLGEMLVSMRQKAHLTLEEAAKFSLVQPKHVQALEEGRYKDLPPAVYCRGFLQSLARLYRGDREELWQNFEREAQISKNAVASEKPEILKKFTLPRFILNPKSLAALGVVIVVLAGFGYLYFQVNSLNRPPRLEIVTPEKDDNVESGAIVVHGQTEAGAEVFINNQEIVVDASGEFIENLSLGPGTNNLVIRATNKFGNSTTVNRTLLYKEKEIAGSFVRGKSESDLLVFVVEIGPEATWVRIETDGIEQFAGTMLPNARQDFTATKRALLTTGNAGSTRVNWDGKDLGVIGANGEVIRDLEFIK